MGKREIKDVKSLGMDDWEDGTKEHNIRSR